MSFDIERVEKMLRLTVTHDELESGAEMDKGIREGWPRVLSSLKTFLESAKAARHLGRQKITLCAPGRAGGIR